MTNSIRFYIDFIQVALRIFIVRKKNAEYAKKYLLKIERELGGKFDSLTFKKVVQSYNLYLPVVMDAFTSLRNRNTNLQEQERCLNYFIMSSLFDNFTDYGFRSDNEIKEFVSADINTLSTSFDEKVSRRAHFFLLDNVYDKESYLQNISAVLDAQIKSRRQRDLTISINELKEITFQKGGYSVLLCKHYLDFKASDSESQCWLQLGAIIQLTNDLYDVYKDQTDNLLTFPLKSRNAAEIEKYFLHKIEHLKQAINSLPYPSRQKLKFKIALTGTYSFGLVAIENLKKIQGSLTSVDFSALQRKDLIIDMSNISNISLWLKFVFRNAQD